MQPSVFASAIVMFALVSGCSTPMPGNPGEPGTKTTDRCDEGLGGGAETLAATGASWREVYGTFVLFRGCDDGAIAEGFSDVVTTLLAERWTLLPELRAFAAIDPEFDRFVLYHIDETTSRERLEAIVRSSRDACPAAEMTICRRIEQQALIALRN